MKRNIVLILGLVVILFSSCGNQGSNYNTSDSVLGIMDSYDDYAEEAYYEETEKMSYDGDYDDVEAVSAGNIGNAEVVNDIKNVRIPDKIIKTGTIGIEVENYNEAIKKIKNDIEKWKGYISNENENTYSYMTTNVITIRVASENFENLINDVCDGVKKVESKSVSAVDVSEEFVDIQTRLKTKKEVEKRYIDLLKQAKKVEEILYVEDKIRVIREEIEAKEGRLKYLSDRVAYSTITLDIKEYYKTDKYEPGFFDELGDALGTGWDGFLKVLVGFMYLWPLWLITGVGLYILLKLLNRGKRKNVK